MDKKYIYTVKYSEDKKEAIAVVLTDPETNTVMEVPTLIFSPEQTERLNEAIEQAEKIILSRNKAK